MKLQSNYLGMIQKFDSLISSVQDIIHFVNKDLIPIVLYFLHKPQHVYGISCLRRFGFFLLLKDNNVWLHLFCLRTPTHNIFIWDITYSRNAFTKTTNIRYEYTCVNNRFQLSHTIASDMRMICGICLLSSCCLHRSQYQECYNHFHIIDSFVIKFYIWMI